ncbi:MAG: c-type cytochrome [Polyangiaceae bacterium]|nr:c-type cytochrome [Polyangiaceae bacterium]
MATAPIPRPTVALAAASLLALTAALGACTGGTPPAGAVPTPKTCAAASAPVLTPVSEPRSSTIVLGSPASGPHKGKLLALMADVDAKAVVVVDIDGKKPLSSLALSSEPGQLILLPDGRVLVAMKRDDQLLVLHPKEDGTLALGCSVSVGAEPASIALAKDELLVTTAWSGAVDVLGLASLDRRVSIEVAREPRQIWVDDDGTHAFVTHASGGLVSVVDLAARKTEPPIELMTGQDAAPGADLGTALERAVNGKKRRVPGEDLTRVGSQGFAIARTQRPAGRLLAPLTLVDPGPRATRSQGYGSTSVPVIPSVAVIDEQTRKVRGIFAEVSGATLSMMEEDRRFSFGFDTGVAPCLLPRDAVVDDPTSTLLVVCLGIDAVVAYDAASVDPHAVERLRWNVPAGPTGLALDPRGRRVVVASQHDRVIQILRLDAIEALEVEPERLREDRIALEPLKGGPGLPFVLGRQIFHATGDLRISGHGLACASCHVDGREDTLVWATPDGPRRTRTLDAAADESTPLGWDGVSKGDRAFLEKEFVRLHGQGLRNVQLEALLTYMASLTSKRRAPRPTDASLVEKGRALFESAAVGCALCHVDGGADGKQHDVGTKTTADRSPAFDTPELRGVARRAPYFHDGRHATLEAILEDDHGGSKGESKSMLDAGQQQALLAFLRSL